MRVRQVLHGVCLWTGVGLSGVVGGVVLLILEFGLGLLQLSPLSYAEWRRGG